jgi:hypothetical protein
MLALLSGVAPVACGGEDGADGDGPGPSDDGGRAADLAPSGDDAAPGAAAEAGAGRGRCGVENVRPAYEGRDHDIRCAAVSYGSKPPASGRHYDEWAVFRTYSKPVPWGFLVHALEHGAVVIAYNCPAGCADELAEVTRVVGEIPRKACGKPPVIVTPDPTLDVRFAAAAWGHILRGRCFDADEFGRFIRENANRGPELFADDCGIADREATGWCP